MQLFPSIIDIDSIQVKDSLFAHEHNATKIEALANTIIDLGGLVNIPVVQQINLEDYELISGHLEYYAYLKAIQLNSKLPDRLTVFISNKKNEAAINKQLEILETIENTQKDTSVTAVANSSEIDLQIKNLQSSINHNNEVLSAKMEELKTELFAEFENKLPKPIPILDAFNRILEPEISLKVKRKLQFMGPTKANKIVSEVEKISKRENH